MSAPQKNKIQPISYVLLAVTLMCLLFPLYAYTQQDSVRAAVVRSHLQSSRANTIFVTFDEGEPSDGFIQRFSTSGAVVRKKSQGILKFDIFHDSWGEYYVDKLTGQKGKLIAIGGESWWGPFIVKVEAAHPGHGERFTVVGIPFYWVVTSKEPTWIE